MTAVTGSNFVGLEPTSNALGNLLGAGEHVVIYDAPKTGKTSLILHTLQKLAGSGVPFTPVSVSFHCARTLSDFCTEIGSAVLKAVAGSPSEFGDLVGRHLSDAGYFFDPVSYEEMGEVLKFDGTPGIEQFKAVFSLPAAIAEEREGRIIVTIDNFQNIMFADEGADCCNIMAEKMKETLGGNCTFLISGSRLNAMKEIFEFHTWFNHAVRHLPLPEPDDNLIIDYAIRTFLIGGKVIERDLLLGMCRLFRSNMWYINTFCSICDTLAKGYILEPTLEDSLKCLIALHEYRFNETVNELTTFQLSLLKAIIAGEPKLSSAETIRRYNLNSSANVRRLKEALCKKEIVTFDRDDNPRIIDPLFEYWASNNYFKIKR